MKTMTETTTARKSPSRFQVIVIALLVLLIAAVVSVGVLLLNNARAHQLEAEQAKCEAYFAPSELAYWRCMEQAKN